MIKTLQKLKKSQGFVLLFAVTLAAILFSIALGIANVALNEVKFSTSATDTNNAFFAADTGTECALFYDNSDPTQNIFTGTGTNPVCAGSALAVTASGSPANFWSFTISGLGTTGQSCVIVTVDKTDTVTHETKIIAKGHNLNIGGTCSSSSTNIVSRELDTTY